LHEQLLLAAVKATSDNFSPPLRPEEFPARGVTSTGICAAKGRPEFLLGRKSDTAANRLSRERIVYG